MGGVYMLLLFTVTFDRILTIKQKVDHEFLFSFIFIGVDRMVRNYFRVKNYYK